MDPITAIAAATTAFNAIKKGFSVGRDVESMSKDLTKSTDIVDEQDELEPKNSVEDILKDIEGPLPKDFKHPLGQEHPKNPKLGE